MLPTNGQPNKVVQRAPGRNAGPVDIVKQGHPPIHTPGAQVPAWVWMLVVLTSGATCNVAISL